MSALDDVAAAASLFAVDPAGLGGVCLRCQVHPLRDQWLVLLRKLMPAAAPLRRIPFNIATGRLLGGLDLVATLKAQRPIAERGVLAASDGGVVVISMAERLSADNAAFLAAVLDSGEVAMPREAVFLRHSARVGVVALDEGIADDERLPIALADRLAFLLDLNGFEIRAQLRTAHDLTQILAARAILSSVDMQSQYIELICGTALALGAGGVRVSLLACRVARCAAALAGRREVVESDVVLAAKLVLAPRASRLPDAPREDTAQSESTEQPEQPAEESTKQADIETSVGELESRVLDAVQASIPSGLLATLKAGGAPRRLASAGGRAGALQRAGGRGRPVGARIGAPGGRARLNVIETLRAAAPWQSFRRRALPEGAKVRIETGDFRVTHYKQRSRTLTIFAVDASGSAALNRLAEAKGAVELLLAECYIRRDEVAVIAFRGRTAEVLLPPTRSLLRAKRGLAGLPGGGGTPLAAAIDASVALALQAKRRGDAPTLIVLSDGRANIARDGSAGREAAHRDAITAARMVRLSNVTALFIDTAPRPSSIAGDIAGAMGARYVPLPFANAQAVSAIARATANARI